MSATAIMLKSGSRKVSREELFEIQPTLPATRTFRPIPHRELVTTVDYALDTRGFEKVSEEFAVSNSGALMFGVIDLKMSNLPGVTAAIGIQASNNKSRAVRIVVGMRVFCCTNLALSSDGIALRKKHSAQLNLREQVVQAVDTFQGRYLTFENQVIQMQQRELNDDQAKGLIYDAFNGEMMPQRYLKEVGKHYFTPQHAEFEPRTVWSLHNAFTETIKLLPPMTAHTSNMQISRLLGLTSTAA